jgi:hypothetical protein
VDGDGDVDRDEQGVEVLEAIVLRLWAMVRIVVPLKLMVGLAVATVVEELAAVKVQAVEAFAAAAQFVVATVRFAVVVEAKREEYITMV